GDLETLELGRRFPAVLLASHFVNNPDEERLLRILGTCVRHLEPRGSLLLERLPADWQPEPSETWSDRGGVPMRLRRADRDGRVVRGVMEYDLDGKIASHGFTSRLLSDGELDDVLLAAR